MFLDTQNVVKGPAESQPSAGIFHQTSRGVFLHTLTTGIMIKSQSVGAIVGGS